MNAPRIGVVGASARAAVQSLARAGFPAWAIDLFNDRDLQRVAECTRCPIDEYPNSIPRLAARFPPGPVLYTGGLENHPRIVAELSATRELLGNSPAVVERVRDPFVLSRMLWEKGFAYPRLALPNDCCPSTGRWLRKPLRSSGGHGVRFARPGEPPSSGHHFQEYIDGHPMSAVFVIHRKEVALFGITEQLIGTEWLHAQQFQYAGNIGPTITALHIGHPLELLGHRLLREFDLLGVFGVDFILRDDDPYVVEVNPRYPASVEVIEHATGASVFEPSDARPPRSSKTVGKAIFYAPHAISFPASGPWDADLGSEFDPWHLPGFADIPEAGASIETGWPVLSILETGSSSTAVRERLQSRAAELDRLFSKVRS